MNFTSERATEHGNYTYCENGYVIHSDGRRSLGWKVASIHI